jgi:hypothetical protein
MPMGILRLERQRLQKDVTAESGGPGGKMIFCYGLAQMAIVRGPSAV